MRWLTEEEMNGSTSTFSIRRKHERFKPTVLVATFRLEGFAEASPIFVEDISEGGMCGRTVREVREGQRVIVKLSRPGFGDAFELCGAVVARRLGPKAALRIWFDTLSEDAKVRLGALISRFAHPVTPSPDLSGEPVIELSKSDEVVAPAAAWPDEALGSGR